MTTPQQHARRAELDMERHRVAEQVAAVLADTNPRSSLPAERALHAVLTLHADTAGECIACAGDHASDPPYWPCDTIQIVLRSLGASP